MDACRAFALWTLSEPQWKPSSVESTAEQHSLPQPITIHRVKGNWCLPHPSPCIVLTESRLAVYFLEGRFWSVNAA